MSSPSKFAAALVLALALAGVARAQEGLGGPDDTPDPTESQLKACPRLAGVTGRRKAQLMAVYFQLDWAKLDDAATKKKLELFDFANKDDRALLESVLLEKGARPQARGLRCVVAGGGGPALVWLLETFEKAQPAEKGFCLDALFAARSKEALGFLEKCLEDTTVVPDGKAAHEAPPGYMHLRVCDHALRVLRARLEAVDKLALPKDAGGDVRSLMPVAQRDAAIADFRKWAEGDKGHKALLAAAPSALVGLPEDQLKSARALLKRLKVEVE